MSRYYLAERPVILSKNKRNVIAHGRPLSPIGSLRSISPYVPRFVKEQHGDTKSLNAPISVPSVSLKEYQKSAHENLITINNNLSNMLQETFSGIDNICQKVRLCLLDATASNNGMKDLVERVSSSETQKLDTCNEESEPMDLHHDNEEQEENIGSILEEVEETEMSEPKAEVTHDEKPTQRVSNITPFFTILNPQKSADSFGMSIMESISSKLGLSRKCTAENFQKSMKRVAKIADYEIFFTSLVDDVNKEIDEYYSKFSENNRGMKERTLEERRPKTMPTPSLPREDFSGDAKIRDIKIPNCSIEDSAFDNDLNGQLSDKQNISLTKTDFSYPDVYRKRAITDLHRRLLAQVEANDSFIFFQKLMKRNRKHLNTHKPNTTPDHKLSECKLKSPMQHIVPQDCDKQKYERSIGELSKKYQDSLWFKQKTIEVKRKPKKSQKQSKNRKCLPQSYSVDSTFSFGRRQKKPSKKCSGTSIASSHCKCKIFIKNEKPLTDSERCKMHWMRTKYSQLSHKKLKHVDILDDITKNDLLPLKAEYPRRGEKTDDIKDSYLYKLINGNDRASERAWAKLFRSDVKCSSKSCDKRNENNLPRQKNQIDVSHSMDEDMEQNCCKVIKEISQKEQMHEEKMEEQKGEVIRTLSKYIFVENDCSNVQYQVYTVMPVQVVYDNAKIGVHLRRPDPTTHKPSLLPMKELKEPVKKAEWISDTVKRTAKPMKKMIYDPILRRIDKEIKLVSARQENRKAAAQKLVAANSWSPKNFKQYCRPLPQPAQVLYKNAPEKLQRPQKEPRSPPVAELFKRSAKTGSEKSTRGLVMPIWNSGNLDPLLYKKDLDIKKKLQGDLKAQAAKMKSDQERKIWENKYGKSVGQKLLNFIEKQPPPYTVPIPKYALPAKTLPSIPSAKPNQMLGQLKASKRINDNIQTNIEKAIGVIEHKMVDVLCKPSATESIEAFDEMEKEIANVLSMMKTPKQQDNFKDEEQLPKVEEYSEDLNQISGELFKKLDRILESPRATNSDRSSNSLIRGIKHRRKHKPTEDMGKVCFSSTSASGEEKFTITGISPKGASKNTLHLSPFISPSTLQTRLEREDNAINKEPRKKKNELQLEKNSDDKPKTRTLSKQKTPLSFKTQKCFPVQEQVVNLALIDHKKKCDAGDQPYNDKPSSSNCNQSEETSGNGDSRNLVTAIGDTPAVARAMAREASKHQVELATAEVVETSGPYFTPSTSPLTKERATATNDQNVNNIEVPPKATDHRPMEFDNLEEIMKNVISSSETESSIDRDESSGVSTNRECFYNNVQKIIQRVENVYNQLEQFHDEIKEEDDLPEITAPIPVFQEPPKVEEVDSDEFLTPFMLAVKDLRKTALGEIEPSQSSPRLHRSPSYYNVLSLLNTLTDFREEQPIEIYTARIANTAHVVHIPVTFHRSTIENQRILSTTEPLMEIPKKRSGCLKKPSIDMTTSITRSKQKVSFLLQKEEKTTQVTACPLHAATRVISVTSYTSTTSLPQDEEISAYLDASEGQSVDQMLSMDENTCQSSLEFTDETSTDQMPEPIRKVQDCVEIIPEHVDNSHTKVVEIFRNCSTSDEKPIEKTGIHPNRSQNENKELINGSFNENSIQQIKRFRKPSQGTVIASLERLPKKLEFDNLLQECLKESPLFEPVKNLNHFIDSKFLKLVVTERQRMRAVRRLSSSSLAWIKKHPSDQRAGADDQHARENENFLKGIYVFVYFLMFTALNLEYKCVN